jgi:hypothetical protein
METSWREILGWGVPTVFFLKICNFAMGELGPKKGRFFWTAQI